MGATGYLAYEDYKDWKNMTPEQRKKTHKAMAQSRNTAPAVLMSSEDMNKLEKAKSTGGKRQKLPSHASGLNAVPHDNYKANLHAGEMILTSKAANIFRSIGGTKDKVPVYNISNNNSVNNGRYNQAPNITINVDVKGTADNKTANDIGQAIRKEIDALFRQFNLQRV